MPKSSKLMMLKRGAVYELYVDKEILIVSNDAAKATASIIAMHYIMDVEYSTPKSYAVLEYAIGCTSFNSCSKSVQRFISKFNL